MTLERRAGLQEVHETDAEVLQEQLCSALCCLAEAQMGLAGEVQEVAEDCEALLLRAAQAAQSSPEPMQVGPPSSQHPWQRSPAAQQIALHVVNQTLLFVSA